MGEILKFPTDATRLDYRRVRRRARRADDPNQLDLFAAPAATVMAFTSALGPFEHALLCDERGDARAGELYAKAIESQDRVADAHCNLGILESKKGNAAAAFDCFTLALKHDPRHLEAHYNLANLYFELNDFRLAQVHYEMTREIDPTFANVYFNLALVQASNKELAAAIATLTTYQQLVSPEDARHADDLLRNLKQTLAATKDSRSGS
jgi:tetratricopeptide (TPR) repeat protein